MTVSRARGEESLYSLADTSHGIKISRAPAAARDPRTRRAWREAVYVDFKPILIVTSRGSTDGTGELMGQEYAI